MKADVEEMGLSLLIQHLVSGRATLTGEWAKVDPRTGEAKAILKYRALRDHVLMELQRQHNLAPEMLDEKDAECGDGEETTADSTETSFPPPTPPERERSS